MRNLSFDCKERDLYQYFSKYGKIIYVKIVRDKVTGISKGTCFIKFETTDSVQRILTLYKRLQNQYSSEKNSTDVNTESLLLDDNRFILNGRPLYLSLALSSSSLQQYPPPLLFTLLVRSMTAICTTKISVISIS